jgi:hypothetical protein
MPLLELETPEAVYRNDMRRDEHFIIDCICGGTDGEYSGFHYKNADERAAENAASYVPLKKEDKRKHTFYLGEPVFLRTLRRHEVMNGDSPLVIVCNDCQREFPFTSESYADLKHRMMVEYNRRFMEDSSSSQPE